MIVSSCRRRVSVTFVMLSVCVRRGWRQHASLKLKLVRVSKKGADAEAAVSVLEERASESRANAEKAAEEHGENVHGRTTAVANQTTIDAVIPQCYFSHKFYRQMRHSFGPSNCAVVRRRCTLFCVCVCSFFHRTPDPLAIRHMCWGFITPSPPFPLPTPRRRPCRGRTSARDRARGKGTTKELCSEGSWAASGQGLAGSRQENFLRVGQSSTRARRGRHRAERERLLGRPG